MRVCRLKTWYKNRQNYLVAKAWRISLYASLLLRGVLYFGTAGNGRYLYAVDVKSDGRYLNLKPVARSTLLGSMVKFCSQIIKNKPVFISAKNGLLLKKIEFEFWFSYRSDHTNKRWQALRYGK